MELEEVASPFRERIDTWERYKIEKPQTPNLSDQWFLDGLQEEIADLFLEASDIAKHLEHLQEAPVEDRAAREEIHTRIQTLLWIRKKIQEKRDTMGILLQNQEQACALIEAIHERVAHESDIDLEGQRVQEKLAIPHVLHTLASTL